MIQGPLFPVLKLRWLLHAHKHSSAERQQFRFVLHSIVLKDYVKSTLSSNATMWSRILLQYMRSRIFTSSIFSHFGLPNIKDIAYLVYITFDYTDVKIPKSSRLTIDNTQLKSSSGYGEYANLIVSNR